MADRVTIIAVIVAVLPFMGIGFVLGRIFSGPPRESITYRHTSRPMTPREQEAFDRAFDHFEKGFGEFDHIFR